MNNTSYKIVLLGDSTVGKTCLSYRIKHNEFMVSPNATIGCEFLSHYIKSNNDEKVKLLLKERNKSIRRINIESCTGGSPSAQRRFWSFVNNKVKKKSGINCVQSEASDNASSNGGTMDNVNTEAPTLSTDAYIQSSDRGPAGNKRPLKAAFRIGPRYRACAEHLC